MIIKLLILAVVGAFIGWMTNVFAIKLLFRPFEPINILGFKLQGLIPKRREDIAKNIAITIEDELLTIEQLIEDFIENLDKTEIKKMIQEKIKMIVKKKLPPLIPIDMVMKMIDKVIKEEGDNLIEEITEKVIHKASNEINISEIVEKNINSFDLEKIESIILNLAKKELKHIEYLGGLIGFLIGIIQGLIILNI